MITVVGSINYDLVTTTEIVPNGGETVHALNFETYHGGKGANTALAVAKLSPKGSKVSMVGKVGDDEFGPKLIAGLKEVGVDTTNVQTIKDRTGVATILVETNGENRILVFPGANNKVVPEDASDEILEKSDFVIFQNEIPVKTTLAVLERAATTKVKTVYNPSPIKELPPTVWKSVDYLFVNSHEAATIAKTAEIASTDAAYEALDKLVGLGAKAVVITLGSEGAVYFSEGEKGFVPSQKVEKVVDTTGAGDTFLAATVSQLSRGKSMKLALEFASKASAIVVTRPGAASSVPFLHEVEA